MSLDGWQEVTLSELGTITSSKRIFKREYELEGVPFYRTKEVKQKANDLPISTELFISRERYDEIKSKFGVPNQGDILLTAIGTIGEIWVVDGEEEFYFKDGNVLWFREFEAVNPYFLRYALRSFVATLQRMAHGAAYSALPIEKLKTHTLLLPPRAEQNRIVSILDEAFSAIAKAKENAEKNLLSARELFESYLNRVFTQQGPGWLDTGESLNELCELIIDCEHKTAPTQAEGIPSIRTPNIGKGKLLLDGVRRVSDKTYTKWTRRGEPRPGDLILAREAPAGNVGVIPENTKVCLGQRTVLIRPRSEIFDSHFLAYLLLEPQTRATLLGHARGATVQHVNMRDIRALKVGAIPSLQVQKQVVEDVNLYSNCAERLETIYTQKLANLDELKQSLLQKAFTGQLAAYENSAV